MNEPLTIIFGMVVNFALFIIFLRFMFQFAQIDPKHPYSRATYTMSAVVTVFGRIFPDLDKGRISVSALVLMLLLTYIEIAGIASIKGQHLTAFTLFFAGTLSGILSLITALKYVLFASVVVSWVTLFSEKNHPIMDIIMQMSEPIVAPFRRITPSLGMLDLSVMVALLCFALMETVIQVVGSHILEKLV